MSKLKPGSAFAFAIAAPLFLSHAAIAQKAPSEPEMHTDYKGPTVKDWESGYYKELFDNGIIIIPGEITEETSQTIRVLIELFELKNKQEPQKELKIIIQSGGGNAISGSLAIASRLRSLTRPVTTVCEGEISSTAFDIFMAGKKRQCYADALLMNHPVSNNYDQKVSRDEKIADNKGRSHIEQASMGRWSTSVRMSVDQMRTMFKQSCQFDPKFALRWGFVHEIIESNGKIVTTLKGDEGAAPVYCPSFEKIKKSLLPVLQTP
jgi:ATP-dependent protease ClpP protease subunit